MTPTIGILGGGQLGRMLSLAGIPLGLKFRFLEDKPDCPAAPVGEVIVGGYEDAAALGRFADGLTVATYEFENVPATTARWLTDRVPVFPPEAALAVAQDRLAEKTLFRNLGIGTPEFRSVDDADGLAAALASIGFPSVLKTRRLGYDGKGQWVLRTEADARSLHAIPPGLILERFVPFRRELSIIAARSRTGDEAFFPVTQNTHRAGILRESVAPAPGWTDDLQTRAETVARKVMQSTAYVGVLAIELFEMPDGSLLANEIAPRVHNSGHWTQNGAGISQFELHLRAILGWPLGAGPGRRIPALRPTAMLNLLRERPDPSLALSLAGSHAHLYGKPPPRAGERRKIGHVNITADDPGTLEARLEQARRVLAPYV
ncbi:MAG: 5-(carboxyamino)imidazole ribonucleotide synthase [Phycisphaerales bacterium]